MSLELTKDDLIEAAARGFERVLSRPDNLQMIAQSAADSLARTFEILPPKVLAWLVERSETTLNRNHVEWGFDKSVAMGREGGFYLLSQVIEALKAKVVAGRRPAAGKVTTFPNNPHQKAS